MQYPAQNDVIIIEEPFKTDKEPLISVFLEPSVKRCIPNRDAPFSYTYSPRTSLII